MVPHSIGPDARRLDAKEGLLGKRSGTGKESKVRGELPFLCVERPTIDS